MKVGGGEWSSGSRNEDTVSYLPLQIPQKASVGGRRMAIIQEHFHRTIHDGYHYCHYHRRPPISAAILCSSVKWLSPPSPSSSSGGWRGGDKGSTAEEQRVVGEGRRENGWRSGMERGDEVTVKARRNAGGEGGTREERRRGEREGRSKGIMREGGRREGEHKGCGRTE